jgi:hypothetical protein
MGVDHSPASQRWRLLCGQAWEQHPSLPAAAAGPAFLALAAPPQLPPPPPHLPRRRRPSCRPLQPFWLHAPPPASAAAPGAAVPATPPASRRRMAGSCREGGGQAGLSRESAEAQHGAAPQGRQHAGPDPARRGRCSLPPPCQPCWPLDCTRPRGTRSCSLDTFPTTAPQPAITIPTSAMDPPETSTNTFVLRFAPPLLPPLPHPQLSYVCVVTMGDGRGG